MTEVTTDQLTKACATLRVLRDHIRSAIIKLYEASDKDAASATEATVSRAAMAVITAVLGGEIVCYPDLAAVVAAAERSTNTMRRLIDSDGRAQAVMTALHEMMASSVARYPQCRNNLCDNLASFRKHLGYVLDELEADMPSD